jgi:hypothetical protein
MSDISNNDDGTLLLELGVDADETVSIRLESYLKILGETWKIFLWIWISETFYLAYELLRHTYLHYAS